MRMLVAVACWLTLCLPAGAAIDGRDIRAKFCPDGIPGCGTLLNVQNNHTGFGDTYPPTGNFVPGSELNQLYVFKTPDALAINITGNLEMNGNAWVIFLDVKPGGSNVLNATVGPGSVTGQSGNTFDPGFEPDYAVAINTAGNVYVDLVDLQAGSSRYLGYVPVGGSGVLGGTSANNPNETEVAFDNTNNAGVIGSPPPDKTAEEHMADAATALKGMEMRLKLADIGVGTELSEVKIMVVLVGSSGYMSNQTLPGIGAIEQKWNLGSAPIDFSDEDIAPGLQYATVNVSTTQVPQGPLDGNNIPQKSGSANLVATQNNYTGFGNASGTGTAASFGSELNALFMRNTQNALEIGITGNLEPNGNYLLLFLETGPGGVIDEINVPEGVGPVSGILQGLNGTVFDWQFSPTHVVMVDSGTDEGVTYAYLHIFDFRTNTSRYLGRVEVNSGSAILEQGQNLYGALMAFDNSNSVGVTDDNNKTPEENEEDALTADTGLELYLPFADISLGQTTIRYMAVITGNSGYFSNQFLPGLGGGVGNLGDPPQRFDIRAGDQFDTYLVTGLNYESYPNVTSLKAVPDGTAAIVTSTVSAVFLETDEFYIQDSLPDGLSGILVRGMSFGPQVGDLVAVEGLLTQYGGERAIIASSVQNQGPGTLPQPVTAANRVIGGSRAGENPGITNGFGPTNSGLLMRTTGRVTFNGFDPFGGFFFYMDDGSGLFDGNGSDADGLRVDMTSEMVWPNIGDFIAVTGISSTFVDGLQVHPRFRPRTIADIEVIETPPAATGF